MISQYDHRYKFSEFKNKAPGKYIQLENREHLDEKIFQVYEEIGFCRLYSDKKYQWISGLGLKGEDERYIYYIKIK